MTLTVNDRSFWIDDIIYQKKDYYVEFFDQDEEFRIVNTRLNKGQTFKFSDFTGLGTWEDFKEQAIEETWFSEDAADVYIKKNVLAPDAATETQQILQTAALGAPADASATTDTGTFSIISLIKRGLEKLTLLVTGTTAIHTRQADKSQFTKLTDGTRDVNVTGTSLDVNVTASSLPTGAATLAEQQAQTTILGSGSNPSTGSGLWGWLIDIYNKLVDIYTRQANRSQKTWLNDGTTDNTFTDTSVDVHVRGNSDAKKFQQFNTLATTTETAILSYTVTLAKTLYIKSIIITADGVGGLIKVCKGTVPVAYGGSGVLQTNGDILLTLPLVNNTAAADSSQIINFPEPIPFGTNGEIVHITATPRLVTSSNWYATLIGDER